MASRGKTRKTRSKGGGSKQRAPRATEQPVKAPLGKKVFFALLIVAAFFVMLELAIGALWQPANLPDQVFANPNDPQGRKITLPPTMSKLSWAVEYNLISNVLTYPDPDYLFRVQPNPGGGPVNGITGINALGFRGANVDFEATKTRKRILLLGDSCAFGWGIPELPKTFAGQLESELRNVSIDAEVINLGQPGYSTSQGLLLFRHWVHRVQPEVVLLYFGWNDLWEAPALTDSQTIETLQLLHNPLVKWVSGSRIFKLLHVLATPTRERSDDEDGIRVPRKESLQNFAAMIEETKKRGARVAIILSPYTKAAHSRGGIARYNDALKQRFEGEVWFAKLERMQQDAPGVESLFLPDGYHPNEAGAQVIASELAAAFAPWLRASPAPPSPR